MIISVSEQTFAEEVLCSRQPVLVEFWAPWCGLCRLITPTLLSLQGEWHHQIKLVRVNADENLKLANSYRLTNLPTLLLFQQGYLVQRIEGFQGRDDLQATLRNSVAELIPSSVSQGNTLINFRK